MAESPKSPNRIGEIIRWDPELAELVVGRRPQRSFTTHDQLERLLDAGGRHPEFGVMHQVLALCALPRTNPGDVRQYRRENGWWTLTMTATGDAGLPFGSYPRLLLAWVCTEAVRTRSPVLTLGDSLADFMRTLGVFSASAGKRGTRTQLRDQMQRLFHTSIRLTARQRIGDMGRESSVAAVVASRTELWWNLDATGAGRIEHGKVQLAQELYDDIAANPVPLDLRTLRALRRCSLGIDLYLWLNYVVYGLTEPKEVTWPQLYRQFANNPRPEFDRMSVQKFRTSALRELKKIQVAWPELRIRVVPGRGGAHGGGKVGGLRIYPSPTKIQPRLRDG